MENKTVFHSPLYPENPHDLWNAREVMTVPERHPSAGIWLDGHNRDANYGTRADIHYVNPKAMLDTPEAAYAQLAFFADRVELIGFGRQPSLTLSLR